MPGNWPLCSYRYAMFVSYLGTRYKGSQRLNSRDQITDTDTIQGALEWSLENFLPKKRCRLTASSRTDRGVHALMNCYTLPLMDYNMPTEVFRAKANENLMRKGHDIVVNEVFLVPNDTHPRKSVISREYIYRIGVTKNPRVNKLNKIMNPNELVHFMPANELYRLLPLAYLDMDKVHQAMNLLRGEHDFGSFTFKPTDINDTTRTLEMEVRDEQPSSIGLVTSSGEPPMDLYQFHFRSTSFLHNQIRRIMGAIISYASYDFIELKELQDLLDHPTPMSWTGNLVVAEPWGLYLSRLHFDPKLMVRADIEDSNNDAID